MRRDIGRVIIDECLRARPEVLDEIERRFGRRPVECVVLHEEHPGLPDRIILERLMDDRALLVTRDRALHNLAIGRNFASLLQTDETGWTEEPIAGIRPSAHYPAKVPLAPEDHIPPRLSPEAAAIAGILNAARSERERKHFRTKRRRIRAYFGTPANIGAVALTIAQRPTRRGVAGGYKLKIDSRHGTKGLFPASEGYFLDTASGVHPLLATSWAVGHLYGLHLQDRPLTFYHLDDVAGERCAALLAAPQAAADPIERMLVRLLAAAAQVSSLPCAKGRFFDQMTEKLDQVTQFRGNELVPVGLQAIASALASPSCSEHPHPCGQSQQSP